MSRERPQLIFNHVGETSVCRIDKVNGLVSKKIFAGKNQIKASMKYLDLKAEYLLIKSYLGQYAIDTKFIFNDYSEKGFFVELEQEYIKGVPLRSFRDFNNPAQRDFFQRCLNLYEEQNIIPDIIPDIMPDPTFGVYLAKKYGYHSGPNIYLIDDIPILIDTTLNRHLRNKRIGPLLNMWVASEVKRKLNRYNKL